MSNMLPNQTFVEYMPTGKKNPKGKNRQAYKGKGWHLSKLHLSKAEEEEETMETLAKKRWGIQDMNVNDIHNQNRVDLIAI